MAEEQPFWKAKSLEEMTEEEWESLCDGCARCCLIKLTDPETDEVDFTDIVCRLLDLDSCRCSDYANRRVRVPQCEKVTPELARTGSWLPSTCAYRLVAEGKDLYWWHPLVSGDPDTVHKACVSVKDRVIHESPAIDPEDRVVSWPR